MTLKTDIQNIKDQINTLQTKLDKLVKQNETNIFLEFLEKESLKPITKIEYKLLQSKDKVKCRIKNSTLYEMFKSYVLQNKDIDIILTKSNYSKILIRNNIKSTIYTGISHLLLQKQINLNEPQEVIICGECNLEMPFDDYEYHIKGKRCRNRQKILELQREMNEKLKEN
jgi:hypothetical protein